VGCRVENAREKLIAMSGDGGLSVLDMKFKFNRPLVPYRYIELYTEEKLIQGFINFPKLFKLSLILKMMVDVSYLQTRKLELINELNLLCISSARGNF
jgi:hypothetical protein